MQEKIKNWFKSINFREFAKQEAKNPIFWARFFAYAIPLTFLLYILYINFLPFGYDKTFVINAGSKNDIVVSEFYLEPSTNLSEDKVDENGKTYRELNGSEYAIFKPKAILKNATVAITTEDEGIFINSSLLDFDKDEIEWENSFDFNEGIPKGWGGNALMVDDELTFNGENSRIYLPYSRDRFEDGPFSLYMEWSPTDEDSNSQQIVGHYNWELWQNKNNVEFRVGRMNDNQGPAYSIKYTFDPDLFFYDTHSAIAIYNPSDNGYIELYIDDEYAGRTYIGKDKIYKYYGDQNLTIGWSPHNNGNNSYFSGTIYDLRFALKNIITPNKTVTLEMEDNAPLKIELFSNGTAKLRQIKLNAVKQ